MVALLRLLLAVGAPLVVLCAASPKGGEVSTTKKVVADADVLWKTNQTLGNVKNISVAEEVKRREYEERLEAVQRAILARQEAEARRREVEASRRKSDAAQREAAQREAEASLQEARTSQPETNVSEKQHLRASKASSLLNQSKSPEASASTSATNLFLNVLSDLANIQEQAKILKQQEVEKQHDQQEERQRQAEEAKKKAQELLLKQAQELKLKEAQALKKKAKEDEEERLKEAQEEKEERQKEEEQEKVAEEAAEELRQKEEQERKQLLDLQKKEEELNEWMAVERSTPNVSLYCFSLMMPFGYEPDLLAEQQKHSVGIYSCDEHVVFSNQTIMTDGRHSPVEVYVINESLAVELGGEWMTALNTPVFNRIWMAVVAQKRYRYHDWTVKVDPDSVFFPSRLRGLLRHKAEYRIARARAPVLDDPSKCGMCKLQNFSHETCASHVRWLQRQRNSTCTEALNITSRAPPEDCGCECDDFACDLPEEAMYLNNCRWGLHGPIEVLSRRTVAIFAAGLPKCVNLLEQPWGEDKFLDECLRLLQVRRFDEYSLLSETACGSHPAPCGTANVAFHPFKSIQGYFICHAYASKYGEGPAAPPAVPVLNISRNSTDVALVNGADVSVDVVSIILRKLDDAKP